MSEHPEPLTAVRRFAEDLVAEIGSMRSMQSWGKVETEARRSAYDDVLAVISDRLATFDAARKGPGLDEVPWWPIGDPARMAKLDAWAQKYVLAALDPTPAGEGR